MTAPPTVRLAMGQMLVEAGVPEANLARAEAMIAEAAAQGAQVIVLPETLDLGWTAAEAAMLAETIPGERCARLARAAEHHQIMVAAGLTERAGDLVYNSAVLFDRDGRVAATHRKIAELDFARQSYATGTSLGVADTSLGRVGLAICADYWTPTLGLAQAAMGSQILLSPSAWAVPQDFDNARTPYGDEWMASYRTIIDAHDIPIVGVSNVGHITSGGWAGHACIGASIAMGRNGIVAARGPFGARAEALVIVDLELGKSSS